MTTSFRPHPADLEAGARRGAAVTVTVARPPDAALADWMSLLRDWLNRHGIEPSGFKYKDDPWGSETYEVSFRDSSQADLFAAEFDTTIRSLGNLETHGRTYKDKNDNQIPAAPRPHSTPFDSRRPGARTRDAGAPDQLAGARNPDPDG